LAEFRWILLGLGLLLIVGIWWWGARRSAQAPGDAELRETTVKDPMPPVAPVADLGTPLDVHGWDKSPFEPISIKTSDFEHVPILDEPMMVDEDVEPRRNELELSDDADTIPNSDTGPLMAPVLTNEVPVPATPVVEAVEAPLEPAAPLAPSIESGETSDRIAAAAPRKPNNSEKQKIITMRVCAPPDARWSGSALLAAFELHGLAYGRYQVFHRRHVDGRSLFSVASLVEPGTFDVAQMPEQYFKGVTLFAVLPGPVDPLLTIDEMLAAARGLAGTLPGIVQDSKGAALSVQKMVALREDVAQFQATLPAS
jgi:cell division protein ZipA